MFDYKTEMDKINAGGEWFRPGPGQYSLKILTEPEITDPFIDAKQERNVERIRFKVEYQNKAYDWCVCKAKTKTSLYGQLMLLGLDKTKLEGAKITLVVNSDGQKKIYTILEALPLTQNGRLK